MRPTLGGLNADQWFTIARTLSTLVLLCLLVWLAGRLLRRCVRSIADHRRAERERRKEWQAARRRRQFRSETPRRYLLERSNGLVWPAANDDKPR